MSAAKLYGLLRSRYHLQPEMLAPSYVLMLSSAADTEEGFSRLLCSLRELDRIPDEDTSDTRLSREDSIYRERPVVRHSLFRALNSPQEMVPFENAEGSVSAEYLYLYPPGVPLLAPGEVITPSLIRRVDSLTESCYELKGTSDHSHDTIWIMKEDTPDR